jgi:hypothetical protein
MAIYLAKMSMHDLSLSVRHPSLLAVGAIYVSLKICEQIKAYDTIRFWIGDRLKIPENYVKDRNDYFERNFFFAKRTK